MANASFTRDEVILALDVLYFSGEAHPTAQTAVIQELSALLNELCTQAPLWQAVTLRAYDAKLGGVEVSDSGTLYFENCYWEE